MKTISRLGLTLLIPVALLAQTPGTPSNLKTSSATNRQVVLAWTAGSGAASYLVERRMLGGAYAALAPNPTAASFTDSGFDAFSTYTYRVTSLSPGGNSLPSNEVTTGPPPVGFNVVLRTPTAVLDASQYGPGLAMALDSNGDPAMAFVYVNPSNVGTGTDSVLYFVGWDRANYQWKNPVKIDICGSIDANGTNQFVSLAADSSNGRLGVAYQKNQFSMAVAFSTDGGNTWGSPQPAPVDGGDEALYPSLAMSGGQAFLAYNNGFAGITYVTGSETAAPSSWIKTRVPEANSPRGPVSLALDNTGKAGVAYWYDEPVGPSIGFWRAGNSTTTRVVATNFQNDNPDLRLIYNGAQPRIFAAYYINDNSFNAVNQLWAIQSADGGGTWATPVALPNDGNSQMQGRLAFANNSVGFATAVALVNGGNSGGVKCGIPKWSRSADFKNWTTCSPQGAGSPVVEKVNYPTAAYAANDKLYLAFDQFDNINSDLPTGIILYREPPVAGLVPPQLSTGGVVNGAGFASGAPVAPGSIVSIFGTNLTTALGGATSVPLSTTLVNTSVSIGGKAAPLYFVGTNQINAQVPFEVPVGTPSVTVTVSGLQSNSVSVKVANTAPGIFLVGGGYVAAQDANYQAIGAGPDQAAKSGQVIVVYATGQGSALSVPVTTGAAAPGGPTAQASSLVTATIGGQPALVQYAGLTAGFVGLLQVNLQVPTVPKLGDYPLIITIGGVASNSALLSVVP